MRPETYAFINKEDKCEVLFYSRTVSDSDLDAKDWYAGRLFLKYYYTAFDQENLRIRIAEAWHRPDEFLFSDGLIVTVVVIGIIGILLTIIFMNAILFSLGKRQPTLQTRIIY